jgi:hypothetical protein
VDAKDFWSHLEYRVCREIESLRGDDFRGLWCDGFCPEQFELIDDRAAITGRVWMGRGSREQEDWRFSLILPEGVGEDADVDWNAVLPADDVSGWLSEDGSLGGVSGSGAR